MNDELSRLFDHLPKIGRDNLSRHLARTTQAYPIDIRTPLYGEETAREILIDGLETAIGHTDFEELEEQDDKERRKIGPISIRSDWTHRRDTITPYWHQSFSADKDLFAISVAQVASLLPRASLRSAHPRESYELMPKGTLLGLPYFTSDRSYVGDYLQRVFAIRDWTDFYPFVIGWRGTATGLHDLPKQRPIWMADHADTIWGGCLLYPLLDALKRRPGFSAWLGDVYVDVAITDLLQRAGGRTIVSSDFSAFDASLPGEVLDGVRAVYKAVFSEQAHAAIDVTVDFGKFGGLVTPDGLFYGRTGGVPSGKVLTNMDDSIANLLSAHYVALRAGSRIMDFEVLGDDSVFVYDPEISPEDIAKYAGELGLDCNPEKQYISTNSCHYLQRIHTLNYMTDGLARGVRSPYRAFNGMIGHERWIKDDRFKDYLYSAQWIMQMENVKNDPRFRDFVLFIKKGDRILSTGIDPKTVFRRAGGAEVVRSVLDIASFPFNVQNPDKVNEFETSKVLRELSGSTVST